MDAPQHLIQHCNRELEERVIAKVVRMSMQDNWDIFVSLDDRFEEISRGGDLRIARSIESI